MYLIDSTYFVGKIAIDNVNEPNSPVAESLNTYIESKCRQFLQITLGSDFADFDSNVINGVLKTDAPQKWLDLVNGKDEWKGLIYTDGIKFSLLADLAYHTYMMDDLSKHDRINTKNANYVSETHNLVSVWNRFSEAYRGDVCWNRFNGLIIDNYPHNNITSMLQFLLKNPTDYVNVGYFETDSTYYNSFGL